MRSKILQEIIDETPEDVVNFVRWYADLLNFLSIQGLSNDKDYEAAVAYNKKLTSLDRNSDHYKNLKYILEDKIENYEKRR